MNRHVCLICLLVTTILETAVFVGLVVGWHLQRSTQSGKVESSICIRNDTFAQSAENSIMTKGLERIVEQMVAEKYDSDLSPETTNLNLSVVGCTPSLEPHPILRLEEIASHAEPVQGKASKVYWKSGITAVSELMHLEEEGSVYIKEAGQYYVSSQLTLETDNISKNSTTGNSDVSTKHIVYAISYEKGEQVILMEREKSSCNIATERSEQTSHMAAVFKLQEKDRVFVATSHPHNIIKENGACACAECMPDIHGCYCVGGEDHIKMSYPIKW